MDRLVKTYADAEKYDSKSVKAMGRLSMSLGIHSYPQLTLGDGNTIALIFNGRLERPTARELATSLGKSVLVSGILYVKEIPDKYGVKGRLNSPYLMDIMEFVIQ